MNKKTLIYAFSLLLVAGTVGAISVSAHGMGFGFGPGEPLFTQEELEAKIVEKVADGTLTQAQADLRLEHMAQAEARQKEMQARRDEEVSEVANFLGLSVEDFQAQIEAGKRINEIAEERGISQAALNEFHQAQMLEHQQERLQQLVDDDRLTQEEADQKLEQLQNGEFLGPMMSKGIGRHEGLRGGMEFGF
jgi:hypothetical protein